MYLQKIKSRKLRGKNCTIFGILKVNDENGRIRIRTKMPRIRNNA